MKQTRSTGVRRFRWVVLWLAVSLLRMPIRAIPIPGQAPASPSSKDSVHQVDVADAKNDRKSEPVASPKAPQTPEQKQLAEDSAKLLILANELKAELDKSTKDTLSLTVVKKAEEVEKLAHKVKEEMKKTMVNQ